MSTVRISHGHDVTVDLGGSWWILDNIIGEGVYSRTMERCSKPPPPPDLVTASVAR